MLNRTELVERTPDIVKTPAVGRPRVPKLVLALALGGLIVLGSLLVVTNAVATPLSPEQVRIQGWVGDLRDDALTTRRQEAQRQLEASGEAAVPALTTALHSNDPVVRRNAAEMLGYIAAPGGGSALSQALKNDSAPVVRRNAAWALGEIPSAVYLNDLNQAAALDSSALVRQTALDAQARVKSFIARSAGVDEAAVNAVAVAPSQAQVVYLASGRELVTSRDGGSRWDTFKQALPSQVATLTVNPTDPNTIYAGMDSLGLYVSSDGGKSWTSKTNSFSSGAIGSSTVTAIAVDPTNAQRIVIAHGIRIGTSNVEFVPLGVLQSADGGKTWKPLADLDQDQNITRLAVRDSKVYALARDRVLIIPLTK